ncbi:MAG: hypothetical protein V3T99_02235 [Nitrososphaerales archaeon]
MQNGIFSEVRKIIIIPWFVLMIGVFSCEDDNGINLELFRELARNTSCATITNRLFLIDEEMVFWDRRGNCSDNLFSFTLFGRNPDVVLCYREDSIGGTSSSCEDDYQEIFNTIMDNLDKSDLRLGNSHQVEEFFY